MTVRNIAVERFSVTSAAPFETVVARIDEAIGHPDMSAFRAAVAAAPSIEEDVRCDRTIDISPSQPLSETLTAELAKCNGPTPTRALVAGSPAIDAVNDGACPPAAKDQRGVSHPQDGNGDGGPACDIGSFELTVGVVAPLAPPGPLTATSPKPPGPPPAPVNQPLVTAPEPPPPVEPPPPLY